MCLGNNGAARQAQLDAERTRQELRQQEDERQGKIRTGQGRIDEAFGQFDEPYFSNFRQSYINSKNPGVADQYTSAKDRLIAALADRGVLKSTIAANSLGDLERRRNDVLGGISDEAFDAANSFRGKVQQSKSDLYALNTASADPDMIATRARGESTALIPPRQTSELGDLFGSILAPVVNYTRAGIYSPYGNRFSGFFNAPTSGRGNSRVSA